MAKSKKIKNPLRRRVMRDMRSEKGKYISIFLFLVLMISVVSGILVTSSSMLRTYDNGVEKYKLEDGHFTTYSEASVDDLQESADKIDEKLTVYEQYFYNFDYTLDGSNYSIRIYKNRDEINTYSLFDGDIPKKDGEIAVDRLFAENNDISVGDTIDVNGKVLTVCGTVAVPDYSCLFENNSDTMFNASTFTVGFVTDDYFDEFSASKLNYGYAYIFDDRALSDREAYDSGTELTEQLSEDLAKDGNYITDFLIKQNNKAVNFTREDIDGDSIGAVYMLYVIIALLAFIFALITFSAIENEAGAIGTLRASGYTRNEIIIHYMEAPIIIFIISAVVGNIIGYACLCNYMKDMYYHSYSLPVYNTYWNSKAFLMTTVIPIVILIIINYLALKSKLTLSPLKFLRRDLSKRKKKRAKKLPDFRFFTRFRLRTILQNMPNYLTMLVGIFMANILSLFSASMLPLVNDYTAEISDKLISDYQYTLKQPVETENDNAEKFCMTSLQDSDDTEVVIYGISDSSKYITDVDMPSKDGEVMVSDAYMNLNNYEIGDTLTLTEKYGDNEYTFTIIGSYDYPAAMSVFMSIDNYNKIFDKGNDYYSGYFSDTELTDIDDDMIYNVMDPSDYTKLSDQITDSMGMFMPFMEGLGYIIFVIVIYLLSKVVIEKNAESISLTKILGYNNREISQIYIASTAIAVIVNIAISLPLSAVVLSKVMIAMFREYDICSSIHISADIYARIIVFNVVCFAVLSTLQFGKIKKIPMEEALKNNE